jgi:formylglycine-generating enzyme required for sulfatase activity
MTCPACNHELAVGYDHCENCGAPAYLALALQGAELAHCTYCGARDEAGSSSCSTCGLKKSFKSNEILIGTCRNCGEAWRHVWLYCQTCGVARENGLIDAALPMAASFQSPVRPFSEPGRNYTAVEPSFYRLERHELVSEPQEVSFSSRDHAPSSPSLLSENEVVERMFAHGGGEDVPKQEPGRFFATEEGSEEARSTSELETRPDAAPVVIYDFSGTSPEAAAGETVPAAAAQHSDDALPRSKKAEAMLSTPATPASGPVQTVRFINKPHPVTTPPIDKKLVRIIIVLILLILLFSALIVTGFRVRDLFSKAPPPARPSGETAATASPSQLNQPVNAPDGMVYVPGGVFRMGTDDGDSFESPAHDVAVAPFFMDRTEVTNAQYAEFIKATNRTAPSDWEAGKLAAGAENLPVVNVSWQDAQAYAAWAGKRLPTEAEWEYAARGQDTRQYPWGSNWDATKANTNETGLNRPVAVGSYPTAANPLGLLDLAGNVWEWTAGEVLSYKDPQIALAPGKVIRGGAFYAPKERATTTFRGFAPPDKHAVGIGFRCVKDVN